MLKRRKALEFIRVIGLACFVISTPSFIGEIYPYLENGISNIEASVQTERSKLDIPGQVMISVKVESSSYNFIRAVTKWEKGNCNKIEIVFRGKTTPSTVKHEVYHAYRVSKLGNLDPNGGFLMKWREELLANIYML